MSEGWAFDEKKIVKIAPGYPGLMVLLGTD